MADRNQENQERTTPRNNRSTEEQEQPEPEQSTEQKANPPWTTTGKMTSPKFGSAGSGGGEYEPGPNKN
jgi:hypothetical protein